jgi:hypothetical protein
MVKMLDFEIIYRRIKSLTKTYQDNDTAKALGISPQAVSDAKKRGRIPRTWYQVVEKDFGVTREELCRPVERVSARAQVEMPYSTVTGNGNQTIQGSKIDGASITIGQQNGNRALDVSDRERILILKMRKYASPAMWERLEADLAAAEERYG